MPSAKACRYQVFKIVIRFEEAQNLSDFCSFAVFGLDLLYLVK
jgi:hypothetical protein